MSGIPSISASICEKVIAGKNMRDVLSDYFRTDINSVPLQLSKNMRRSIEKIILVIKIC